MSIARQRDQFYTQEKVARECFLLLLPFIKAYQNIHWVEPSAGSGAFLHYLLENNLPFSAYDIEPKHNSIQEANFLQEDISIDSENIITIGNPPFGKNSSLAIEFFNKASAFSQIVAFIVPSTFEKESVQKRLNKNMHLVASFKLSEELYYLNDKLVKVPTVFQIWEKKDAIRIMPHRKLTSEYFTFTTKDNASFAIQRVGVAAGKVKHDFSSCAVSSHYFISATKKIASLFEKIDWSSVKYNTAGNPSISKAEVVELLEKQL